MFNIFNYIKLLQLLLKGVRLKSFFTVQIRGSLKVGSNVVIGRNVVFEGNVELLEGVVISRDSLIKNSIIGSNAHIRSFSIIEESKIGAKSFVGPMARLRPHTEVGEDCQIGNFVEIKNSKIGSKCRINHMAFLGDAFLGDEVTIGAGTITCNHDGKNIQETIIEKGAYIGSNVNLVAPVKIGNNATIGSGSTITKDVPQKKLTLARANQTTIENWKGPRSSRK